MQEREDLERSALAGFENAATKYGFPIFKGQGSGNRIHLRGNLYFQFGDLRVETGRNHVIVEVESAGGVTNLVKYWYCLKDSSLSKHLPMPVVLFHVFRQSSPSDYGSHLLLWDFLANEMQVSIGERIKAFRYPYRELPDLDEAIQHFKTELTR